MDELELLKKDWQRKHDSMPKLSYDELSKMIWKKSSSIVKWIFYISIFELLIVIALSIYSIYDKEYWQLTEDIKLTNFTIFTNILTFILIGYFVFKFYKNYKTISSTDDTKTLMENILNTRKTVKTYIKIGISFGVVTTVITVIAMVLYDENFRESIAEVSSGEPSTLIWILIIILVLVIGAAVLLISWLLYQLIYGLLLRRLNKNYKELEKMDL